MMGLSGIVIAYSTLSIEESGDIDFINFCNQCHVAWLGISISAFPEFEQLHFPNYLGKGPYQLLSRDLFEDRV